MGKTKETRWTLGVSDITEKAEAWCRDFMSQFDCSKLSRITIRCGTQASSEPVYGTCYFPNKRIKTYRITCNICGSFPGRLEIRRPPIYLKEGECSEDIEPPKGCWPHGVGQVRKKDGQIVRWVQIRGFTKLVTVDEGFVWILMHEAFHFLRRTRQVPGRNIEHYADAYGDEGLEKWREYRRITP